MFSKVFVVLAFAAVALSHDILESNNDTEARNVFDDHFEASPAIWKQTKEVFINASEHEVISKINITDLRPDKDGDAQITAGGVGQKNVTITLKSPTILRGYDFLVSVDVCRQNETAHENISNSQPSQPPQNVGNEDPEIPEEKIPVTIPSDVTTGKAELFTESGPTTVTGKPTEVSAEPTEVTDSTATLGGVTSKPKTKEFSEPDVIEVTDALDNVPEETPQVNEQRPKTQPLIEFRPPHPPRYMRY